MMRDNVTAIIRVDDRVVRPQASDKKPRAGRHGRSGARPKKSGFGRVYVDVTCYSLKQALSSCTRVCHCYC